MTGIWHGRNRIGVSGLRDSVRGYDRDYKRHSRGVTGIWKGDYRDVAKV